jgi:hypothetical protein
MHQLIVPKEKGDSFARDLFTMISENVTLLAEENEKLPRVMLFCGPIGSEILDFIKEKGWSFEGFKLERVGGQANSLVFKYDAPLTQVDDPNSVIFEEGSLHGKKINGIPGEGMMQKMIASYASTQFKIERTVRPEKRITLKRGK